MPKTKEVSCPECWAEQTVDIDDDEIICDDCGYQYYIEESVGEEE